MSSEFEIRDLICTKMPSDRSIDQLDELLRSTAAISLTGVIPVARQISATSFERLIELFDDPEPQMRCNALIVAAVCCNAAALERSDWELSTILDRLRHKRTGLSRPQKAFREAAAAAVFDDDPMVCAVAIRMLPYVGTLDDATQGLARGFGHEHEGVVIAALATARRFRCTEWLGMVGELMDDPREIVSLHAISAVKRCGAPNRAAKRLEGLAKPLVLQFEALTEAALELLQL